MLVLKNWFKEKYIFLCKKIGVKNAKISVKKIGVKNAKKYLHIYSRTIGKNISIYTVDLLFCSFITFYDIDNLLGSIPVRHLGET